MVDCEMGLKMRQNANVYAQNEKIAMNHNFHITIVAVDWGRAYTNDNSFKAGRHLQKYERILKRITFIKNFVTYYGLLHMRTLFVIPTPQLLEHDVQFDHWDQPPSTCSGIVLLLMHLPYIHHWKMIYNDNKSKLHFTRKRWYSVGKDHEISNKRVCNKGWNFAEWS